MDAEVTKCPHTPSPSTAKGALQPRPIEIAFPMLLRSNFWREEGTHSTGIFPATLGKQYSSSPVS